MSSKGPYDEHETGDVQIFPDKDVPYVLACGCVFENVPSTQARFILRSHCKEHLRQRNSSCGLACPGDTLESLDPSHVIYLVRGAKP